MELATAALVVAGFTPGFYLTSPALTDGGSVPVRYTCDGRGVSPPLHWTKPPRGTAALKLTVTDPDVPLGLFIHWTATGIPPRAGSIGEGRHFAHEGANGLGKKGWTPPCPPRGSRPHRYLFVLSALDRQGHVIAEADLITHYGRT